MNTEDQSKIADDITCGECGKTNGSEKVGNSWICRDCKVTKDSKDSKDSKDNLQVK